MIRLDIDDRPRTVPSRLGSYYGSMEIFVISSYKSIASMLPFLRKVFYHITYGQGVPGHNAGVMQ